MDIIDSSEIFKVNDDLIVNVIKIDDIFEVIEIKDFYKDYTKVLDLAMKYPVNSNIPVEYSNFNSHRVSVIGMLANTDIYSKVTDVVKKYFTVENINDNFVLRKFKDIFMFNILFNNSLPKFSMPHSDISDYACVVYLTPGKYGGTNIYRNKLTGVPYFSRNLRNRDGLVSMYGIPEEVVDANAEAILNIPAKFYSSNSDFLDDFDIIFESSGEPNTAVIYPGFIIHGSNTNYDLISDENGIRINQVMFLNKEKSEG